MRIGSLMVDRGLFQSQRCSEELLVMVQVESVGAIERIPEIAAVPGVDAVFLGPFYISCSVGRMGQFEHPEVAELLGESCLPDGENIFTQSCFSASCSKFIDDRK